MTAFGPVHTLLVREVGQRITRYWDAEEFEDYEIEHPAECKPVPLDDEWPLGPSHDCAVAHTVNESGCRWSMAYSGCLINEPGTYQIQAWRDSK